VIEVWLVRLNIIKNLKVSYGYHIWCLPACTEYGFHQKSISYKIDNSFLVPFTGAKNYSVYSVLLKVMENRMLISDQEAWCLCWMCLILLPESTPEYIYNYFWFGKFISFRQYITISHKIPIYKKIESNINSNTIYYNSNIDTILTILL